MMKPNKQKTPRNKKGRLSKEERKQIKEYRKNRRGKRDTLVMIGGW